MGRSYTPTFRVEYRDQKGWHDQAWSDPLGRTQLRKDPTDAQAEEWRKTMNRSFDLGGTNYHVSQATGILLHISEVRIIRQKTGKVVATAKMPMFEVV
jgi:hypothetical protein